MYFSTVWRLLRTNLINIRAMEWKWFCGTSFDGNLSSNVLSVRIYYVHYFARISGSDYLDLIWIHLHSTTATGFQCTNNDNLSNCSYSTATTCIFSFSLSGYASSSNISKIIILLAHFYRTQMSLGSGLWPSMGLSVSFWNFADVTLADDDTNSILADDANRVIWGWLVIYMVVEPNVG